MYYSYAITIKWNKTVTCVHAVKVPHYPFTTFSPSKLLTDGHRAQLDLRNTGTGGNWLEVLDMGKWNCQSLILLVNLTVIQCQIWIWSTWCFINVPLLSLILYDKGPVNFSATPSHQAGVPYWLTGCHIRPCVTWNFAVGCRKSNLDLMHLPNNSSAGDCPVVFWDVKQ